MDSQGYSALSDYLLTYLLTYSLSPALSHPTYREYGTKHTFMHPFDEGLVPCLACLLLHAIGAAVNQITGLLPPRVWRAIRKKKEKKNAAPRPMGCDSALK